MSLRFTPAGSLHRCIIATVLLAAVTAAPVAFAKGNPEGQGTIALQALPDEARQTHRLIASGGPFPYAKDGIVFSNRERRLPSRTRGWYREYTVVTPGAPDRGPRRIVCGGQPPTRPEACWYTADHYASFKRIVK